MKKILIALVVALGLAGIFGRSVWAIYLAPIDVEVNKTNYAKLCHREHETCHYKYWYGFEVPEDGYVSVTTKYGVGESNMQRMTLSGYDNVLAETVYNNGDSVIQTTALVGVSKGNYSIYYDADARDYNFSFYINYKKSNNWETESNNSYGMADVLSPDIAIGGALNDADEDDYYVWIADYTGKARALFTRSDNMISGSYGVSVEDDNNNSLDDIPNINSGSTKTTSTIWFDVVKGRNYYFHVASSAGRIPTGYYQLKIDTNKLNLKDASVSAETTRFFTGSALQPSVIVKYNNKKLVLGKDFDVTYSDKKSFVIRPKTPNFMLNASMGKVYVSWSKSYGGVSGYQLSYSTVSSMAGARSTALKSNKFSAGLTLIKGKRYYVRVRAFKTVNGKIYYSDWSNVKSVINK